MRRLLFALLACCLLLTTPARAASWRDALPDGLSEAAEEGQTLLGGVFSYLAEAARDAVSGALGEALGGAAGLLAVALLCGTLEGLFPGGEAPREITWAAVLAACVLSAGEVQGMLSLGAATIEELETLARFVLPALAAALAAGGYATTAGVWQTAVLLAANALAALVRGTLLPLVYCYLGAAAAGAILPGRRLDTLADALKKGLSWGLSAAMTAFTLGLSLSRVLSGSADRVAVRAAKTVSGAVPIVGRILSDAAESVLAGAEALRGTIGTLGAAAVLALCLAPLARIAARYAVCQAAAFLAAMTGTKEWQRFLEQLGGAFALIFAMTASCALLLLVSLLVAATVTS